MQIRKLPNGNLDLRCLEFRGSGQREVFRFEVKPEEFETVKTQMKEMLHYAKNMLDTDEKEKITNEWTIRIKQTHHVEFKVSFGYREGFGYRDQFRVYKDQLIKFKTHVEEVLDKWEN